MPDSATRRTASGNRGPRVPDEDRIIGEVRLYALARLQHAPRVPEYAPAAVAIGDGYDRAGTDTGIIEID